MAKYLGVDIGTVRTGVAFADDHAGFIVALETVSHRSMEELAKHIAKIALEKKIDRLIVGLPRLPSGEEGKQAMIVRETTKMIVQSTSLPFEFIDERYTTLGGSHKQKTDQDAKAACELLAVLLDRNKAIDTI